MAALPKTVSCCRRICKTPAWSPTPITEVKGDHPLGTILFTGEIECEKALVEGAKSVGAMQTNVGLNFDLAVLLDPEVLRRTLILIGAAVLVKIVPAFLFLLGRLSLREVIAAGMLLVANLSLPIVLATLGLRLGVIEQDLGASIIQLAVVSSTLAPTLFRILAPPLPPATKAVEES